MKLNCILFFILSISFAVETSAQISGIKPISKIIPSSQDSSMARNYLKNSDTLALFSLKRGLYLDSALMYLPENAYLWQQRGMPLFKQKKYEIGMPYLDSAAKYDPKHYMDYRAFMKCIFSKNYASAIEDFKEAKRINGYSYVMDHSYDFYMGLCYLQLNKLDSAEYHFAINIENEMKQHNNDEKWMHHLHWFYYGVLMYEKEDYENAIFYFDKSLKLYPQFSDVKYYKALCLKSQGQTKEALLLLLEAKKDIEKGYTINEDNAIYEIYPYQINKFYIKSYIEYLEENK